MPARADSLARLVDWPVERGPPPAALRRAAARELAELLICVDDQQLERLQLARRAAQLRAQGLTVRAIAERLGASRSSVSRALGQMHDITAAGGEDMDLKKSSIGLGVSPGGLPKVGKPPRPATPSVATPRDNGGLSDGVTGGNFAHSSLTQLPNNSGGNVDQAGADASKESQASYADE